MLHLAVLERIVVAILGVVTFFPRDYQRKRRSCRLLHGDVGHVRTYEPIRGGIHFKHGRGGLIVDVFVHRDRVSIAATQSKSNSKTTWPMAVASTRRMNRFVPAVESRSLWYLLS